jgi:hypothetical protein
MSTRLVAHRPHATFRWNHLARVGQVGGGRSLTRYAVVVCNLKRTVCQSERKDDWVFGKMPVIAHRKCAYEIVRKGLGGIPATRLV